MIEIEFGTEKRLYISYLVLDYNGTLACDGILIEGVADLIEKLSEKLEIHILTADTHGLVGAQVGNLPCILYKIPNGSEDAYKGNYVRSLGSSQTACIGNGRNDRLMLENSAIGITVIGKEGASADAVKNADIVVISIIDALALFLNPLRIKATVRV
jgi:soluble P-type ATPase